MITKHINDTLKQINQPNTVELQAFDLENTKYWIFGVTRVRMKDLKTTLKPLRSQPARFDVFVNSKYIPNVDYVYSQTDNFYIKFIKANIAYDLYEYDTVTVIGDIEHY